MRTPVALVTGATDGIGRATALELARRGYRVFVHGRSAERVEAVRGEIARATGAAAGACVADLARYDQVRAAAAQVLREAPELDVLLANAGAFFTERQENDAGHEMTLAVNHYGHALLAHALMPSLRRAPAARVVCVSSMAHAMGALDLGDLQLTRGWNGRQAYANAKLANVLFAFELARRLGGTGVTANALHPGVIATKLLATGFPGADGRGLDEGTRTSLRVATDPALAGVTGRYFSGEREVKSSTRSLDAAMQRDFYERTARDVGFAPLTPTA